MERMTEQLPASSIDFVEFEGPDFSTNGYSTAKYRRGLDSVSLVAGRQYGGSNSVEVPARLEILTADGWKKHAIVFKHAVDHKRGDWYLVVFRADGRYYLTYETGFNADRVLFENAESKGLTEGMTGSR